MGAPLRGLVPGFITVFFWISDTYLGLRSADPLCSNPYCLHYCYSTLMTFYEESLIKPLPFDEFLALEENRHQSSCFWCDLLLSFSEEFPMITRVFGVILQTQICF